MKGKTKQELYDNVAHMETFKVTKKNSRGKSSTSYVKKKTVLNLLNQLDEPEVLSEDWIDEHEYIRMDPDNPFVYVKDLKKEALLVPKQDEITEEQAWDKLSEIYDIPNESYIREAMKVVANNVDGDTSIGELKEKLAKPIIPQFMADFIEVRKDTGAYSLKYILHLLARRDEMERHTKDYDWIEENEELFTRAWLDGYKVEKGQKYYALIKAHELNPRTNKHWKMTSMKDELLVGDRENTKQTPSIGTLEEWNNLGLNEDNADFVKVKELDE